MSVQETKNEREVEEVRTIEFEFFTACAYTGHGASNARIYSSIQIFTKTHLNY